ncbi:MAG: class I SAM-dependent methyltransferase [Betaproteobacteria bacterium]|nr:class I SAM-dependent methyltransferase [Betaproteobacteria bacterium]
MPLLREFALQFLAAAGVIGIAYALGVDDWRLNSLVIGVAAFILARCFRSPPWWQAIHLVFAPSLYLALAWQQAAGISPFWFLAAFLLVWLVFRSAATGRVPLYLSGEQTARQLAAMLPENAALLDAGAGIGSLLLPLARLRPDLVLNGIENAPLPWLIGKMRFVRLSSPRWRWDNFWTHSFAPYEAVYCFLSPAPMTKLWEKACLEMTPGRLFISKAFPVPDVLCEVLAADNDTDTLYLYRIPANPAATAQ